ncbi:MAG: Tail-specific protease precursor [Lentisphaerae bacterium ADurb.BinA184]|nr:MAG: Tail-specific protease precursor [Lentisphaerae bacterium ADurb.BinA184]
MTNRQVRLFRRGAAAGGRARAAQALWLAVVVLGGWLCGPAAALTAEPAQPRPFDAVLGKLIVQLITTQHYAKRAFDDDVSSMFFDEYFDSLDRERRFFLAADIEEFAARRTQLDNELPQGDLGFAFDVYARFMQRVRERVEYARTALAQPFDFTVDEEMVLDRSEAPWCRDKAELDEEWRKLLKNRVLVFTLMNEQGAAEAAQKPSAATPASPEGEAAPEAAPPAADTGEAAAPAAGATTTPAAPAEKASPFANLPPAERVLRSQERFLRMLEENESLDVLEIFLSSLARVYDPHSTYMAPSTEEDFDINMKLSLEGIGAVLSTEEGYVKIVEIIAGGPADRDGRLHAGDRIVAVAQENDEPVDAIDMPLRKVVRMIRGAKGSRVFLSIIESGKALSSVPTTIELVRDEVILPEQAAKSEVRVVPLPARNGAPATGTPAQPEPTAEVMVIDLPSFYSDFEGRRDGDEDYRSASRDVRKLLEPAAAAGVDGVILDLRNDPGGSLEEAVRMAGLFFAKGPVVQVRSTGAKREVYPDPDPGLAYAGPLVVLTNRLSASASEIVAGAIQDYRRGVIIGDKATHGKGTVQTVLDLGRFFKRSPVFDEEPTGSLKLTIAKFYRVSGLSTQREGVNPDIVFPSYTDHMEIGEATLKHALPGDRIEPLAFECAVDVTPFLPPLRKLSEERLAANPDYRALTDSIARYAAMKDRKTLSLNLEKRRAQQVEEEKWLEEIRKQTFDAGDGAVAEEEAAPAGKDDKGNKGDGKQDDLVLDESLRVMADLIWMQQGDLLAKPAPPPQEPAAAPSAEAVVTPAPADAK